MKKALTVISALLLLPAAVFANPPASYVLDDFNNGTITGSPAEGTTWAAPGNVIFNPTTITIGGTAKDDNGWGAFFNEPLTTISFYDQLSIIGQIDAGHQAQFFKIEFLNANFETKVFQVAFPAQFLVGSLSTVVIPLDWSGFDTSAILGWSIGGGEAAPNSNFRMTLDNIALTSSSIPEPSTYAAIIGMLALGFVAYRRRQMAA